MCDGRNHPLIEIYREEGAASDAVVRWCPDCGSVVVDIDFDGRTQPGRIRKMQTPSYTRVPYENPD